MGSHLFLHVYNSLSVPAPLIDLFNTIRQVAYQFTSLAYVARITSCSDDSRGKFGLAETIVKPFIDDRVSGCVSLSPHLYVIRTFSKTS